MCTVTLITRKRGYVLGMNRDEKRTRAKGLFPAQYVVEGCRVISPTEPGGGTWIASNDAGVTFALINWYSISSRVKTSPVSRGAVVQSVRVATSVLAAAGTLTGFKLRQVNPFRLIGVFPAGREIIEWRWDLNALTAQKHAWEWQQWISSGFDEPVAQRVRHNTFTIARQQASAGSQDWLRRLHRSHLPAAGPFSTCMHRADAATVSYTEVAVSARQAVMCHCLGTPCQSPASRLMEKPVRLKLR